MDERVDKLLQMAKELEEMAKSFDVSGEQCSCCNAFRYNSFPQYQVTKRIEGAAIRLIEIASTIERRQNDPEWVVAQR